MSGGVGNGQPETEHSETDRAETDQPETEDSATDQPETNRAETDQVEADSSETNPPEADSGDTELPAAAVPVGGFWLNPALINGERIAEVRVYLENPTEDAEANGRLEQQSLAAFTVQAGDSANPLFLEAGLRRVQQLGEVETAWYGLYEVQIPGEFESDNRIFHAIEDLYAGVIYGYRTETERLGVNLSVGRQDYRISNGLLFANGAGNGGDRATVLSNLESSHIGQEVTLTARYNLTRNFLLYGSGSVAFPGSAVQSALNSQPGPWTFLQLSVLMNF